ncbi:MAG: arsenate reductase (glutaredoxin) [Flavobacteriales bacterium]|nr:arsenate reductase (glutaredoxin) [Flavobacteriales bacterium]
MMKIYHNPRCSKSRETLQLIKDAGVEVEIVEYLNTIPTVEELKMLLMKLNLKPIDIIRKGEAVYKEKFKNSNFNDDEWIKIMLEYPKLIERPIVVKGNKAILGRPPQNVLDLF